MKIQQFAGGLSTRLRPQYIQVNEGAQYSNIDNSVGTLAPVNKPQVTNIATTEFNTFVHDLLIFWNSRRSCILQTE